MGKLVVSTNRACAYECFEDLMTKSTRRLNELALANGERYIGMSPTDVEYLVRDAMVGCAVGTPFEGTIRLLSGHKFPDIVAGKYFGTEVKSAKGSNQVKPKKWECFGNSIFEGTRIQDVERIFLTFGEMGRPVQFRSKPYEQCISGVAVDHSPRYHVDMNIQERNEATIFEELGLTYDEFRQLDNNEQVEIIARNSKSKLGPGETLWWSLDSEERFVAPTIKVLSEYDVETREKIVAEACAYFPELLGNSFRTKYDRYVMWLVTEKNIVTGSARDAFSAGGRVPVQLKSGLIVHAPAIFGRLRKYRDLVSTSIREANDETLKDSWKVKTLSKNRLSQWISLCVPYAAKLDAFNGSESLVWNVFDAIFDVDGDDISEPLLKAAEDMDLGYAKAKSKPRKNKK